MSSRGPHSASAASLRMISFLDECKMLWNRWQVPERATADGMSGSERKTCVTISVGKSSKYILFGIFIVLSCCWIRNYFDYWHSVLPLQTASFLEASSLLPICDTVIFALDSTSRTSSGEDVN